MPRPNNDDIDIYELLNRADELLEELDSSKEKEDFLPEFEESMDTDDTMVYRNAANGYGRQSQVEEAVSSIRAYNADFRGERTAKPSMEETAYVPTPAPPPPPAPEQPKKQKKKGGCLKKLLVPVALVVALVLLFNIFIAPPRTDKPLGQRRPGTSAILLCGADVGGNRTDTMMLLYVDKIQRQAGLLTLPRDTYTVTDYGSSNKLNSAYGRNGGGEEGMDALFVYVEDIIGYRPDGYVLVELPVLRDLIDLFGGVEFHVPQDMDSPGVSGSVHLEEGLQHLTGEQAMALLRFRYGYIDQDIGRQNVQKNFIKACLKQWITPENFGKLTDVLELFQAQSFTDLTAGNFLWFGWNLLTIGFGNIETDTLPGYPAMIDELSYYVLYPGQVAEMVQDRYNPYRTEITRDMLNIATE